MLLHAFRVNNTNMNSTNEPSLAPPTHIDNSTPLKMVIPLMVFCVVAVVSNLFVCYLIVTVRRLKTTTNVFVFSLCLCDILFAGVLLPIHCFYQHSLLYAYTVIITVLIYIVNLTAATYERLYSITKPLRYHITMTKQRALTITILAWFGPLCYSFLPFIWKNDQTTTAHKIYMIGNLTLFLLGPLIFIVFVYIKVCLEVKKMFDYKNSLRITNQYNDSKNLDTINDEASTLCSMFCCTEDKYTKEKHSNSSEFSTVVFADDNSVTEASLLEANTSKNEMSINFGDGVIFLANPSCQKNDTNTSKKHFFPKNITRAFMPAKHNQGPRKISLNRVKDKMRELKASLAFGVVAMTYMFTWLPVVAMTLLQVMGKGHLVPPFVVTFSIFSIALNALTDPFLYALLLENFRITIKKIICK